MKRGYRDYKDPLNENKTLDIIESIAFHVMYMVCCLLIWKIIFDIYQVWEIAAGLVATFGILGYVILRHLTS